MLAGRPRRRICRWRHLPRLAFSTSSPESFEALAHIFAAVEATKNARAASVVLLAEGYRQLLALPTPDALASALFLTASQLAPAYEGVELRFGAKSCVRFLRQLETQQDECQSLEKSLAQYPDYGQATLALLDSGRISVPALEEETEPLTVTAVHEQLLAIARDEGVGGVARKQQMALRLLQQCRSPQERVFIVRMLAHQSLRIGMGEKSILAALAAASFPNDAADVDTNENSSVETKNWVECVTSAYAQLPNYRVLAGLLHNNQQEKDLAQRIRRLQVKARPAPGVPVLTMSAYPVSSIAAVLERVVKTPSSTATCEYKYDGARVQIHLSLPTDGDQSGAVRRIFSRNMEDVTDRYSSLLDVLQQRVVAQNAKVGALSTVSTLIVEGEVVAMDRSTGNFLPFQVLQTKTTTEFCLFLFDLLAVGDRSLLQNSLRERRMLLHNLVEEEPGFVEFVKHVDIELTPEEFAAGENGEDTACSKLRKDAVAVREFLGKAVAGGCEGLMVKTLDGNESEYKAGRRSYSWMKVKHDYLSDETTTAASKKKNPASAAGNGTFLADTLDLVPIGAFYGKGRRAGVFGSFLLATYNSTTGKYETIGKVGTGFSDAQLLEIAARLRTRALPTTGEVPEMFQSEAIRSRHPDVWISPEEVWEIKATQLTESPSYSCGVGVTGDEEDTAVSSRKGLALRFPRFVRYRPDKTPMQATESEQVLEFSRQQQQQ